MCADFTGPFVSKLTPTFAMHFPVGASLLAKGPLRPVENSQVKPLCLKLTKNWKAYCCSRELALGVKSLLKRKGVVNKCVPFILI
jgi:hypothetical protein